MPRFVIDGANTQGFQITPGPACEGQGQTVIIANLSVADTLYVDDDISSLQAVKAKPSLSPNGTFGTPITAGAVITIPWVTKPLYAMNYSSNAATPTDILDVKAWT